MILTSWDHSLRTETLRILHTAHFIATGFYRLRKFSVYPTMPSKPTSNQVIFPNLNYLSIPRFWTKSAQLNVIDYPLIEISAPIKFILQTQDLLSRLPAPSPNLLHTQNLWQVHETKILDLIYSLIPSKAGSVRQITIWPTAYGTNCSFSWDNAPAHHIQIWLRQDQGLAAIVEAILTSLTRKDVYNSLAGLWSESELLVDWLLSYSPLGEYLKPLDPALSSTLTIKNIRTQQSAQLLQASTAYLAKLGAPEFSQTNLSTLPSHTFTHREREIIALLKSKSPQSASIDELGDLLFAKNPDAYSPAAIAKAIQRIRDKLEHNGISGSLIQAHRGTGYLLLT